MNNLFCDAVSISYQVILEVPLLHQLHHNVEGVGVRDHAHQLHDVVAADVPVKVGRKDNLFLIYQHIDPRWVTLFFLTVQETWVRREPL